MFKYSIAVLLKYIDSLGEVILYIPVSLLDVGRKILAMFEKRRLATGSGIVDYDLTTVRTPLSHAGHRRPKQSRASQLTSSTLLLEGLQALSDRLLTAVETC